MLKTKHLIIILSVLGLLYVPLKMIILSHELTSIEGKLISMEKSRNRNPYFTFHLDNYSNLFYNEGNGTMSYFKDDEAVLKQNLNKNMSFFIHNDDFPKLNAREKIAYIGLQEKNIWIDLFYYHFSQLYKIPLIFFCIVMMIINFIGIRVYKNRIYEILLIIYFFYQGFLMMF